MPSLSNPWVLLGLLVFWLASVTGGFFEGRHYESLTWEKALAKQQTEATTKLNAALQANDAERDRGDKLAIQLDTEHAAHLQDLESAGADFHRQLADGVRDAERRARSRCPAPGSTVNPSVGADPAAGSEPGVPGIDAAGLERIANGAMILAEYAKTCHAWAVEVGR